MAVGQQVLFGEATRANEGWRRRTDLHLPANTDATKFRAPAVRGGMSRVRMPPTSTIVVRGIAVIRRRGESMLRQGGHCVTHECSHGPIIEAALADESDPCEAYRAATTWVFAHRSRFGLFLLHLLPGPKMPLATKLNPDRASDALTDDPFGTQSH